MSRTVVIFNFNGGPPPCDGLEESHVRPLESAAKVRTQISARLDGVG